MNEIAIFYDSKKQKTVIISSTKAKYMTAEAKAREII
jgi:hypothetical protein